MTWANISDYYICECIKYNSIILSQTNVRLIQHIHHWVSKIAASIIWHIKRSSNFYDKWLISSTQFWSFLFFRVTFKVEPSRLLTIFMLFVLYVKASRMIHTVIRIDSRTHTCSYLQGMYIFVFILRKNHT